MNCSDLEKFGAMLEQPELKQWDFDKNCGFKRHKKRS